jgi:hypothetical protein
MTYSMNRGFTSMFILDLGNSKMMYSIKFFKVGDKLISN